MAESNHPTLPNPRELGRSNGYKITFHPYEKKKLSRRRLLTRLLLRRPLLKRTEKTVRSLLYHRENELLIWKK